MREKMRKQQCCRKTSSSTYLLLATNKEIRRKQFGVYKKNSKKHKITRKTIANK